MNPRRDRLGCEVDGRWCSCQPATTSGRRYRAAPAADFPMACSHRLARITTLPQIELTGTRSRDLRQQRTSIGPEGLPDEPDEPAGSIHQRRLREAVWNKRRCRGNVARKVPARDADRPQSAGRQARPRKVEGWPRRRGLSIDASPLSVHDGLSGPQLQSDVASPPTASRNRLHFFYNLL